MIRNLGQTGEAVTERRADVVIVGGGTAGLVLAERLSRRFRVLVLESGGLRPAQCASDADAPDIIGDAYRSPREGRTRALGGTSNIWGGAMLPFAPHDFEAREELGVPSWPAAYDDVAKYYADVEALFRLAPGAYDAPIAESASAAFIARYAKWPSHARRNVATLLMQQLEQAGGPEVWLDATCSSFAFSDGQLESITAVSGNGAKLIARARHFVLAAGAIESTRLLQWAMTHAGAPQTGHDDVLGRFLHDHVSARVAEIETSRPRDLNKVAGFRFDGSTMRSFRLELTAEAQRQLGIAGAFAHIAFSPRAASGFDALRQFMRGMQARRFDAISLARSMIDMPYFTEAAYWRLIHRRLLWPRPSRYELHAVVEQLPAPANRISLSDRRDKFGVPVPRIEWRINPFEKNALLTMRKVLDTFWRESEFARLGRLNWSAEDGGRLDSDMIDVFHPGGTTRMGFDPRQSVVDRDLTVWSTPNLSVASTSTFPTGGGANPTMTLLAFTFRLANFLERRLDQTLTVRTTAAAEAELA